MESQVRSDPKHSSVRKLLKAQMILGFGFCFDAIFSDIISQVEQAAGKSPSVRREPQSSM